MKTRENESICAETPANDETAVSPEEKIVFSPSVKTITVSKPVLREENGMLVLSAKVSGGVSGTCFFATEKENRDYVDEKCSDCFLIGLLFTAMYAGCDFVLEGAVSRKLFFQTRHFLMPILEEFFENNLHHINISAGELLSEGYPDADAVGTGFSGGVDSFDILREFCFEYDGPPEDKINTLLFFNVGSHGMGDRDSLSKLEHKFQERRRALEGYPKSMGFPFIIVNSNIHAFMQSGHLQTSSLASPAAALFLGKKLRLYYLASAGFPYHALFYPDKNNEKDYDIAKIDDFIMPHICTETFSAVLGGATYTRMQKTAAISSLPYVNDYLNVCNSHDVIAENCSMCFKCHRTMLSLDILGILDRFSNVFDLKKFSQRERSRYIAQVLNNRKRDMFLQDICDWAKRMNYDLESKTSLANRLYMKFTETRLYAFLRALLRRK